MMRTTRGIVDHVLGAILCAWLMTSGAAFAAGSNSAPVTATAPASFDAANALYETQRYAEAAQAYEALIAVGPASTATLFNLGNAHFKLGKIGKAILNFRRAELLAPRDPDIRANLQFAREQAGLGLPPSANIIEPVVRRLSANEWCALMMISFWTMLGLLALVQLRPSLRAALRPYLLVSAVGTVAMASALGGWWHAHRQTERCIVETSASGSTVLTVKFGPLEESQTAFSVKDGAEVFAIGNKGNWTQITDDGRRTGWVPESALARLRATR